MLTTIREEQLLAKFAGEDVAVPQPCTRTEKFLAKMAGLDVQTPTPITREEQILNKIAEGGGGGGDSDFGMAEVTIINHTNFTLEQQKIPTCFEAGELGEGAPAVCAPYNPEGYPHGETTVKVPLYKGKAVFFPSTSPTTTSGDIEQSGIAIIITGNGSITWEDEQ